MWSLLTKLSISWLTGLEVEVPLMAGIRPAALTIWAACGVVMNSRNCRAWVGCCAEVVIESPSPAKSTTPLIGVLENGGTSAATLLPSALVNFWVSQVPSSIMAALPDSKSPRLLVLVSTSELVQPSLCSLDQMLSWDAVAAEVHGICPL